MGRTFTAISDFKYLGIFLLFYLAAGSPLQASDMTNIAFSSFNPETPHWQERADANTIRIVTKGLGYTGTTMASDMSKVLSKPNSMQILPVLGKGSLQSISDTLYLKDVELSILQSDVLSYVKKNNIHSDITDKLRYIAKLYSSEVHLVAGKQIRRIENLKGKKVSFGAAGQGSVFTARNVFISLGIDVTPVLLGKDTAIEKVRKGEIAAAFIVIGRPALALQLLDKTDNVHFLPVPFHKDLSKIYTLSELTHHDYPNLIPSGETVPTVSVGQILTVYNWEPGSVRYQKTTAFIDALFNNIDELRKPAYHPKWKLVDLSETLPGWVRFPSATVKLNAIKNETQRSRQWHAELEDQFDAFLKKQRRTEISAMERKQLLKRFIEWRKGKQLP